MPLFGDILRANFFDLKNSLNCQINGDLEPLKGFGIKFFGSYHPLIYLNISSYIRKPFLIYDIATVPMHLNFLKYEEIFFLLV